MFPLLSPVTSSCSSSTRLCLFALRHRRHRQGGPGKATSILVYRLYYDGFKALDLGGSAAQSVVLMVIVITLTVIQFRYVEKKVQY